MQNPIKNYQLNAESMESAGNFNFGDIKYIGLIPLFNFKKIKVRIHGKILNSNAYVISLLDDKETIFKNLVLFKSMYGYPIRQIKLQWGQFTGNVNEFVVPGHELKE